MCNKSDQTRGVIMCLYGPGETEGKRGRREGRRCTRRKGRREKGNYVRKSEILHDR